MRATINIGSAAVATEAAETGSQAHDTQSINMSSSVSRGELMKTKAGSIRVHTCIQALGLVHIAGCYCKLALQSVASTSRYTGM